MILQELYDFAMREKLVPDPDFEIKSIPWLVYISRSGRLINIEGTHYKVQIETKSKAKNKKNSKPKFKQLTKKILVPRDGAKTSNDKAFFFHGNASYVFGLNVPKDKKSWPSEKLEKRRELFRERIRKCAEVTGDEAAQKLLIFLDNVANGSETIDWASLSEKVTSGDLFAFVYGPDIDILMTDRELIRKYWKCSRSPENITSEWSDKQCLVTGKDCGKIGLFPLLKGIPGTSKGVGLVSFNKRAFESYGWGRNENAPICREAAEACSTALNRLIDPAPVDPSDPSRILPRQNVKLSSDTIACYWNRGESEFCRGLNDLLTSDTDKVKDLYRSIWVGSMPSNREYGEFYALTLTGTQGRAILRDWFESTITEVQQNLCQYFADIAITRNNRSPDGSSVPHNIFSLLESVADPAKNRGENIPGHLAGGLINAAFSGSLFPETVLQRAVMRYRSEIGKCGDEQDGWITRERSDARAALIKAALNRKKRKDTQNKILFAEVQKSMDPNNKNPGYLLGRLLAVMEKLQVEALQKEDDDSTLSSEAGKKKPPKVVNINRTVVDRFFSGASATPKAVFPRLLINSKHHEKKLSEKNYGRALSYMKYIDDILFHFEVNLKTNQLHTLTNGFPQHLNLDDQGLFVIGYHHMRHWLWMNKEERAAWELEYSDSPIPRAYTRRNEEDITPEDTEGK